jgi:hypothetical protein
MKILFILLLIGMIPLIAFSGGHHRSANKEYKSYSAPTHRILYNHMYNSPHETYKSVRVYQSTINHRKRK